MRMGRASFAIANFNSRGALLSEDLLQVGPCNQCLQEGSRLVDQIVFQADLIALIQPDQGVLIDAKPPAGIRRRDGHHVAENIIPNRQSLCGSRHDGGAFDVIKLIVFNNDVPEHAGWAHFVIRALHSDGN